MWTWLRRMFWLSLACGALYAAYTAWQRKNEPVLDGPPEWPPLTEPPPVPTDAPTTAPTVAEAIEHSAPAVPSADRADGDRQWVAPIDGDCPDGFPVKANEKSGIYHVPGGRFYERTIPERCYASGEGAEADGYRRAKA